MADYPNNDPSDGTLLIAANNVSSTLNGGVSAVSMTMTLASTANFPAKGGLTIESEAIIYSANNTALSAITVLTRGADSTTAAIHADGATVTMHNQARHHNATKDEVIAIGADLRNCFDSDPDDSVVPSTTAANLEMRVDQIAYQLAKLIAGPTTTSDWKTAVATRGVNSLAALGTFARNFTMNTREAATSTAGVGWTSTGFSITISLQTNTSRVLLKCEGIGVVTNTSNTAYFTFFRGGTNMFNDSFGAVKIANRAGRIDIPFQIETLDSPATNGSVSYTLQFRSDTTTASNFFGENMPQRFIASEVIV